MKFFMMMVLFPVLAPCAVKPMPRAHEVDLARLKQRLSNSGAVVPGPNGFDKGKGAVVR